MATTQRFLLSGSTGFLLRNAAVQSFWRAKALHHAFQSLLVRRHFKIREPLSEFPVGHYVGVAELIVHLPHFAQGWDEEPGQALQPEG